MIIGLGYCSSAKTIQELLKVVSTTGLKPGQMLFVGVVPDHRRRADALKQLDDAAAEAAAQSGVGAAADSKRKGSGR